MEGVNRKIVLVHRPKGTITLEDFELRTEPIPSVGPGTFLLRNLYLSIDPAQRALFNENGAYGGTVPLGEAVWGPAVGEVLESQCEGYASGDLVEGWFDWQDYVVSDGRRAGALGKIPNSISPIEALSVHGLTALTAYFGLQEIGRPGTRRCRGRLRCRRRDRLRRRADRQDRRSDGDRNCRGPGQVSLAARCRQNPSHHRLQE